MKLKEFLKEYYGSQKEINMRSKEINSVFNGLCLPGSYKTYEDFRKTLSWNLDREVYYREVSKEYNSEELYVTLTTGKMEFYLIFDTPGDFQDYLEKGLKKHRGYRKETLSTWDNTRQYLFYSRKYE